MSLKSLTILLIAAIVTVTTVVSGMVFGVHDAAAEDPAGAVSGPWRCKAFGQEEGVEQMAAAWLYRYAPTGPSTVVSLSPSSASGRAGTTLCAWDPGFAGQQWMDEERSRRVHERQVEARKRSIKEHSSKGSEALFPEDTLLDEDDPSRSKK